MLLLTTLVAWLSLVALLTGMMGSTLVARLSFITLLTGMVVPALIARLPFVPLLTLGCRGQSYRTEDQ